jgi:hypothetical protein
MPDKNCKPGCGNTCLRCWRNKLKHANPQAKAYMRKHKINFDFSVDGLRDYQIVNEENDKKKFILLERTRRMTDKKKIKPIIKSDYQI